MAPLAVALPPPEPSLTKFDQGAGALMVLQCSCLRMNPVLHSVQQH